MDTKTPLGELIESARKLAGYSQQQVADRASRRGFTMSKQNVGRLVNDMPLASIKANWIKGIAVALGLSESRVAASALASMGVDLGIAETPLRQAILDATEIDERTKRSLLALIDANQKEDSGDGNNLDQKSNVTEVDFGQQEDDSYAGPNPGLGIPADEPGEPSEGQRRRDEQNDAGEQGDE